MSSILACLFCVGGSLREAKKEIPPPLEPIVDCLSHRPDERVTHPIGDCNPAHVSRISVQPERGHGWWHRLRLRLAGVPHRVNENCYSQPILAPEHPRHRRVAERSTARRPPNPPPCSGYGDWEARMGLATPEPSGQESKKTVQSRRASFVVTHRVQLFETSEPPAVLDRDDPMRYVSWDDVWRAFNLNEQKEHLKSINQEHPPRATAISNSYERTAVSVKNQH
ncbi:hypothetical protein MBLNU459_g2619t2 [Dothideomycetes sp. NU459]